MRFTGFVSCFTAIVTLFCLKVSSKLFFNKCCSLELSLHQVILKKVYQCIKSTTAVFKIDYKKSPNQHIRMISEGSCGTESWSNNAECSFAIIAIIHFLKYIQIEKGYF